MKKYIAEALGTFTLALVVALSIVGKFPVSTPVLAGLVVLLFVYSIGHISGAHINPAITIGVWSIKKISNKDALFYVISQFIGGAAAIAVVSLTVGMPLMMVLNNWNVVIAECLGTLFFAFGITCSAVCSNAAIQHS